LTAKRLFDQLQNNIEPFREAEFPNLVDTLTRMNVPLSELRKEVFALWSFAFHLMLNNSAQKAHGNLATVSRGFDFFCSEFVSVNREYGDGPEDFLARRQRYAAAVSAHLNSGASGTNISEPLLGVIFPVLMANASEDILYNDAATLRKTVDRSIELFMSLCSVCLEDLRKIKLID
jgi:hypothetical protein